MGEQIADQQRLYREDQKAGEGRGTGNDEDRA